MKGFVSRGVLGRGIYDRPSFSLTRLLSDITEKYLGLSVKFEKQRGFIVHDASYQG